ncbi:MAG: lipoate--protein ligase family protein [Spirochaetales bacterium]|nr:lipoate--protein ligase family protein [Spirochaetales bacterium]
MIIVSPYRNVYDNLAFEDLLFDSYDGDGSHLLLYVDEPAVVMGRFQNPWKEMNLPVMSEYGVVPARRISGGGCVYHDEGNLNFCLFSSKERFSRSRAAGLMTGVLTGLGINARVNDRHDILVDGKKVSGSAYRLLRQKAYHHGTLLVDACIERVPDLLSPTYRIPEGQGILSVVSPVENLSHFCPGLSVNDLIDAIVSLDGEYAADNAGSVVFPDRLRVQERAAQLASREWVFGRTPPFNVEAGGTLVGFPKGQLPQADGWSLPLESLF